MKIVETIAVPVGNIEDSMELYNLLLKLREYLYRGIKYNEEGLYVLTKYDIAIKNKYCIPVETLFLSVLKTLSSYPKEVALELLNMEFNNTGSEYKHITKHLAYKVTNNGIFNALIVYILDNEQPQSILERDEKLDKLHRETKAKFGIVFTSLMNSIKEDPIKALCGPYDGKGVLTYDKPGATDGTQFKYGCEFSYERKLFNLFIKSMPDEITFEDRVSTFSNAIILLRQFVVNVYNRLEPVLRSQRLQELGIMTKIPYRKNFYNYEVYTTLRNAYDVVTMLATLGSTKESLVNINVINDSMLTKEAVTKELEYVTTVMLDGLIDKLNILLLNTLIKYAK